MSDRSIVVFYWNTRERVLDCLSGVELDRDLGFAGGSSKRKLPALTRIQYHRSLHRFLRKYRAPLSIAAVVALRMLKGLVDCVVLAPPVLISRRLCRRWLERGRVFAWQLQGCPEGVGLRWLASQK